MLLYGLSESDVRNLVAQYSADNFGGNLYANVGHSWNTRKGPRTRFVLRCHDSHKSPARASWTGRRTVAVDWQTHADVLRLLFAAGATRVVTTHANYTYENFEDTYPGTYWTNVGSQISPAYLGAL